MSQKLCARTSKSRAVVVRLSFLGALAMAAVAFGNMACEDKKLGLPCDVGSAADDKQNEYNDQALECPSRICLKPAVDPTATMPTPKTVALCSLTCSQDSDCVDPQIREPVYCPGTKDPCPESGVCVNGETCTPDQRCNKGFACGIVFVKGRIACKKLCVCRDFIGTNGIATPAGC